MSAFICILMLKTFKLVIKSDFLHAINVFFKFPFVTDRAYMMIYTFAKFCDIDYLITDGDAPESVKQAANADNVTIL